MSPRTPQQLDGIREKKRKHIMDTALGLFANKGYFTTSINDIAKKAKIAKGLVYNYFKSKDELLTTIIDRGLNVLSASFDPDKDGILTDEEFDYFVDMNFKLLQQNTTYWRLLFTLMMQPEVYHLVVPKYTSLIEKFNLILEDYYRSKGYDNPKLQALAFGAFMDGLSMNYLINPDLYPVEEIKLFIKENYTKQNQS